MFLSNKKAREATGLCGNTLRQYADSGKIPYYRLPNGDRMFDVRSLVGARESVVCYARVSTWKQKGDLENQVAYLSSLYPAAEIVRDCGSGLNFKRKGLNSLLERAIRGEKLTVVVSYRDRLARFGFDLIERIIARSGGKVVVLNKIDSSPSSELVADLMAIVTVFSSRLHGLRDYKKSIKGHLVEAQQGAEEEAPAVDGGL